MAFFNREKKAEEKRLELERQLKSRGLEGLSKEDKESVLEIIDVIHDPYGGARGSEAEIRQIEYLSAITEQNFLIIKLLDEINQK